MQDKKNGSIRTITATQLFLYGIISVGLFTFTVLSTTSFWVATPMVFFELIGILGVVLSINLNIVSENISEYVLYSFGLALSFLVLGGLAINWVYPMFGIIHPLGKIPIIVFFDIVILLLLYRAYYINKNYSFSYTFKWPHMDAILWGYTPLFFVGMSILGAEMLNNGGSGILTLCMLFLIAMYVVGLMCVKKDLPTWVYVLAIYCISLSLLFMYSLRSSHILGWDIHEEYQVFKMTFDHLIWKMSNYPGLDYNACISVTILPTIFGVLTNIQSEYIYKCIFQLIFAITPVMIYVLARRYLSKSFSFLSALLLLSQTWFYEQMPALIRQEVAFLFYILIIIVLFDKKIKNTIRYVLLYVFTIALIVSHYSTSYIYFTLLIGASILYYGVHFFDKKLRKDNGIKIFLFLIPVIFLLIWEVPITHTGKAISNFLAHRSTDPVSLVVPSDVKNTPEDVSNISLDANIQAGVKKELVPAFVVANPWSVDSIKSAFSQIFFAQKGSNTEENILLSQQRSVYKYGAAAGYNTYNDQDALDFVPHTIDDRAYTDKKIPTFLVIFLDTISRLSKLFLVNVCTLVGLIGMCIGLKKEKDQKDFEFLIFSSMSFVLIVLMIFVPYIQAYYNFTRLFLQMFFILSIFSIFGGIIITNYIPKYQKVVLTCLIIIVFLSLSGAFGQITGGEKKITLNQVPGIYDSYYVYDSEIAGARWLSVHRGENIPVQADAIAGLRLESFGNFSPDNYRVFPQTILRNGFVYLSKINFVDGKAFNQFTNNTLVYQYPLDFLSTHKNLIYNNGGSVVYK